jgi:hypothetical protein
MTPTATIAPFGSIPTSIRTAVADVNGDGVPDIICVTGPGVPVQVAVVSGTDDQTLLVQPFDPFESSFTGGGFVAAGDFQRSGRADIVVTPDEGGGPRVLVLGVGSGGTASNLASFYGITDPNFRGGARPAVGDVTGDGIPDLIVAAGFGGGPRVTVFDGRGVLGGNPATVANFYAFPGDADSLRNGVYVAAGDVNGDGHSDLIFGGGPGGGPRVLILSGKMIAAGNISGAEANPIANFFVGNNSSGRGGVRVAAVNMDGDDRADVAVGSGEGDIATVQAFAGSTLNPATDGLNPAQYQILFGGNPLADGVYVG